MRFTAEETMERSLIEELTKNVSQWTYRDDLRTEDDLWENLRHKLNMNNKAVLDDVPLSDKEFEQVKNELSFPNFYRAAEFLAGENGIANVRVVRDDPRVGEIRLMVMNNRDIAGGSSSYEIINQYQASKTSSTDRNRIFDVTLLINGLPMIHIELKNRSTSYMDAFRQIDKYSGEGKFKGIFSSIQMFVVTNGVDTRYIAAAQKGKLNSKFLTRWVDENNKPVNNYLDFAKDVLSIPQAHKMVGQYSVLDSERRSIILLRPYQIHAIEAVQEASKLHESGYVWHTTGSGKTLTSYKVARNLLLMNSIEKTIFIVDRVDLDQQTGDSFKSYSAHDVISIDDTDNVNDLIKKLYSQDKTVIVTTIQKLNHVMRRYEGNEDSAKWKSIRNKKLAFVVDECHRAVSSLKKQEIEKFFNDTLWYGFTGTPIFEENAKEEFGDLARTTEEQYGKRLHEYTVKEAIHDNAVLGFQIEYKSTFTEDELRDHVDRQYGGNIANYDELNDIEREELIKKEAFETREHKLIVIDQIINKSRQKFGMHNDFGKQYSAILTTDSIASAQEYYKLFREVVNGKSEVKVSEQVKKRLPDFPKVAITYSISENEETSIKNQERMKETMEDYNKMFGTNFTLDQVSAYNRDVNHRLARKQDKYKFREEQLDLVIVVDRLLTGFDAPSLAILFMDRNPMPPHNLIQAFSRTNRLYDEGKKYGQIMTFRTPHTFEEKVDAALYLYSNGGESFVQAPTWEDAMDAFKEAFNELMDIAPNLESIDLLTEITSKKKFAKAFQAFDKKFQELQVYSNYSEEIAEQFGVTNEKLEDYTAKYNNIIEEIKAESGEDDEDDDIIIDIAYEINSVSKDTVNHEYILGLIQSVMESRITQDESKERVEAKQSEIESYILDLKQSNEKLGYLVEELWKNIKQNPEKYDKEDVLILFEQLKEEEKESVVKNFAYKYAVDENDLMFVVDNFKVSSDNQLGENDLIQSRDYQVYKSRNEDAVKPTKYRRKLKENLKDVYIKEIAPLYER